MGNGGRVTVRDVYTLLETRLEGIERRQDEMLTLIREMNGHVRDHGQQLAGLQQWKGDHGEAHGAITDDVDNLRGRTYGLATLNGILTAIGSIIAGIFGRGG
jgi:hypothetical protein